MLTTRKKKTVLKDFGIHETDTGSAAVQVALISKSIEELTLHLKHHPKDHHSRRGLLQMVGKRRRLLAYLAASKPKAHGTLIKKLGLKK